MARAKTKTAAIGYLHECLRRKEFSPVYFFHGEEDFLIEESVRLLIDESLDPASRSFNLDTLYGGDADAGDIVARASAFPMTADCRVVVIREVEKLPGRDLLISYVERSCPSTILVLTTERPDFRQRLFNFLQDHAVVVEFRRLFENEIPEWISKRVERFGKRITAEAAQLLQIAAGRSLREICNEVDKLLLYVGDGQTIGADDVNAVVGASRKYNVFELQRAIGQKNLPRSLEILEHLIETGENAIGMIVLLTKYFHRLWMLPGLRHKRISNYELAAELKVQPSFIGDYIQASQNFPSQQLLGCLAALLDADASLKLSGDPKLVMTLLLYRLLAPEKAHPLIRQAV